MTEIVGRRTGRTYRVGERLDPAGHGTVYAVEPASSDLVLKQYLPETLTQRPAFEARIKAMIADPPAYRTGGQSDHVSCTWPVDAAYISDRFAGFLMPRVDTGAARTIRDVATSSDTTWLDRVATAENLARVVALLHVIRPSIVLLTAGHSARVRPDAGPRPQHGKAVSLSPPRWRVHRSRAFARLAVGNAPNEQQRHLLPRRRAAPAATGGASLPG